MTMDDIVQGSGVRPDPTAQGDHDMAPICKIGIVGAGQMGSGIAHVVALHGYDVGLHDVARDKVDAAIGVIDKNL
ncbi:MAG TPA: 3-hydroxyacyl-CoA dehydrogenase NAD-binding domain-containing protein, partial [Methyloceanibacter sp.]|nr:3-hydroxyacyl-CoA dehydrogenase NAD-binding domain-containing protein [Methyloceanibacter sp.]